MVDANHTQRNYFEQAFQLAYWIHVNKEIAFFVAEDALDALPTVLGKQKKTGDPLESSEGSLSGESEHGPFERRSNSTSYKCCNGWSLRNQNSGNG
jgi:hypothetical protein